MLQNKGWQGSPYCHLWSPNNIPQYCDHLFLLCPYVSHIWFWMRKYQQFYINWQFFMDVIQFSKALPKNQLAFLIVLSATVVRWTRCKMRKESYFSHTPLKSIRQMILMIYALAQYQVGNMEEELKSQIFRWLPAELDMIPIQCLSPLRNLNEEAHGNDVVPLVPLLLNGS